MTFFDKKTEVINFELTPYGRELLSQGKLIPKYYDFEDSDILYDISYDGNSKENPEDAHNRIMNETPRLKNMILKSGIESNFVNYETGEVYKDRVHNKRLTYDQRFVNSMGRSSYESDVCPSFSIEMLQGEITSASNILTSSVVINMQIPQIEIDFSVIMQTGSVLEKDPYDYDHTSDVFNDGKYVYLEFESPIMYVSEADSDYEKENFDIEVYRIQEGTIANYQSVDKILPLNFGKLIPGNVQNEIFHEIPPGQILKENTESPWEAEVISTQQPDTVDYFFDIVVDEGIPLEEICKHVDNIPIKNQFLDRPLECPDRRDNKFDLYSTRVTPEDIEDCDP